MPCSLNVSKLLSILVAAVSAAICSLPALLFQCHQSILVMSVPCISGTKLPAPGELGTGFHTQVNVHEVYGHLIISVFVQ